VGRRKAEYRHNIKLSKVIGNLSQHYTINFRHGFILLTSGMAFPLVWTFLQRHFAQALWLLALLLLFFMDPTKKTFSFCLFKLAGFSSCPGCGIGHAIHHTLRLEFSKSINAHPLGIPATISILCHLIHSFYIVKKSRYLPWTNNNNCC
jgi:ABC-type phosphate transport system permease subunit